MFSRLVVRPNQYINVLKNGILARDVVKTYQKSFLHAPSISNPRPHEAGPGGRSSNADVTVAVFGAGSFIGGYVCDSLGTNGVRCYVGNRGDEFEMRDLKPCFDLGRLRFVFLQSERY